MTSSRTETSRTISIVATIVLLLTVSVLAAPGASAAVRAEHPAGQHQPAFTGPSVHTSGASSDLRPALLRLVPLGLAAAWTAAVHLDAACQAVHTAPTAAPTLRRCGGVGRRAPPAPTSS